MKCERCFKETNCTIMSMYNTDIICMECKEKERKRPDYEEARRVENEHVKAGNYNFGGIGYK